MKYMVKINGRNFEVEVEKIETHVPLSKNDVLTGNIPQGTTTYTPAPQITPAKIEPTITIKDVGLSATSAVAAERAKEIDVNVEMTGVGNVTSPMPGNIFKVVCSEGQPVKVGDVIIILEAMKMENEIVSPIDGVVQSVKVKPGDVVDTDALLAVIR